MKSGHHEIFDSLYNMLMLILIYICSSNSYNGGMQQIQAVQALDPYSDGCSNSSRHLVLSAQTVHVRNLWLGMLTSLDIRRNGYLIDKKQNIVHRDKIRAS